HDDLVQDTNGGQLVGALGGFPLDGFHGGHLGQGDITAGRDRAQAIGDAVDFLLPDRFSEPDGEAIDLQTPPAGGDEMAQFVDEDQQIEEEQDLDQNEQYFQCLHNCDRSNRYIARPTGELEYSEAAPTGNDGLRDNSFGPAFSLDTSHPSNLGARLSNTLKCAG